MKKSRITIRFGVLSLLILVAALSRLIPHPSNFAPIGAMALFGAAYYSQKYLAFLIPIISMWISDLLFNNILYAQYFDHFVWFYQGFYWTYSAFILIAIIGYFALKEIKIKNIVFASILAFILGKFVFAYSFILSIIVATLVYVIVLYVTRGISKELLKKILTKTD